MVLGGLPIGRIECVLVLVNGAEYAGIRIEILVGERRMVDGRIEVMIMCAGDKRPG